MKVETNTIRDNYESEIDEDARSAYAEVMGRIKSAETDDSGKGDGEGAASRTPASSSVEAAKEAARDDGRDQRGRFAGKAGDEAAAKAGKDQDAPAASKDRSQSGAEPKVAGEVKPDTGAQPVAGGPPPSFSVKTKADWNTIPEHVRADIVKREGEMQQGLSALRDFKDLKPYAELATKHNTSIKDYIDRTLRIEGLIKQDLGAGIAHIAQNAGLNQQQAAQLFANLAQKFGGQPSSPQAGGRAPTEPGADPLAEALRPILSSMLQPYLAKVDTLHSSWTSREQADRNAQAQSLGKALETFASDPSNQFYADLEPQMVQLFERGLVPVTGNHAADIKTAYEMAARMHPEVSEALIEQRLRDKEEARRKQEQEAADKGRMASRSLTGSRIPGSRVVENQDAAAPNGSYDSDLEADVMRAYRSVRSR
jgi:hypothetical protein